MNANLKPAESGSDTEELQVDSPEARTVLQNAIDICKSVMSKVKGGEKGKDDEPEGDGAPLPAEPNADGGAGDEPGDDAGETGDGKGNAEGEDDDNPDADAPDDEKEGDEDDDKGHEKDVKKGVDTAIASGVTDIAEDDFVPPEDGYGDDNPDLPEFANVGIDVTELIASVEEHMANAAERETSLVKAVTLSLESQQATALQNEKLVESLTAVVEQNSVIAKGLQIISGTVTEMQKGYTGEAEERNSVAVHLAAISEQLESLGMNPLKLGTPRGVANATHVMNKGEGLDYDGVTPGGSAAPATMHGMPENDFLTGLGIFLRENPHSEIDLMKSIRLKPEDRSNDLYRAAFHGLGKTLPESLQAS